MLESSFLCLNSPDRKKSMGDKCRESSSCA